MSFWEDPEDIGDYHMDDLCGRCGHALRFHVYIHGRQVCVFLHGPRNPCGCCAPDSDAFDESKNAREDGACARLCERFHPRSAGACMRSPGHENARDPTDREHVCARCARQPSTET